MAQVKFHSEDEFEAAIADRVSARVAEQLPQALNDALTAALADIEARHATEIAALNDALAKSREQNATADYSAYSAYPDLIELMKAADLRPSALPALCALQIWQGATSAVDICAAIPTTPKLGEKGGVASTPKMITGALQKLEKALISANTGVGIRVTSVRGKDGNSTVKKIRFQPMVDLADDDDGDVNSDANVDQQAA